MLGDILSIVKASSGTAPSIKSAVTGVMITPNGAGGSINAGLGGGNSAPVKAGTGTGTPQWTTGYSATNFTNNDLGNNTPDPSMQATLNDPHAAILAPPAPPPAPAVTTAPAPAPASTATGPAYTGTKPEATAQNIADRLETMAAQRYASYPNRVIGRNQMTV